MQKSQRFPRPAIREVATPLDPQSLFEEGAGGVYLPCAHAHARIEDAARNDAGIVLATGSLHRVLSFDDTVGVVHCEAGMTISELLQVVVPRGWIPAVIPPNPALTIGGAIARDIWGDNHAAAGSFGHHVLSLSVLRSNGEVWRCGPHHHKPQFEATVGGLGLTGLILSASVKLVRSEESEFRVGVHKQARAWQEWSFDSHELGMQSLETYQRLLLLPGNKDKALCFTAEPAPLMAALQTPQAAKPLGMAQRMGSITQAGMQALRRGLLRALMRGRGHHLCLGLLQASLPRAAYWFAPAATHHPRFECVFAPDIADQAVSALLRRLEAIDMPWRRAWVRCLGDRAGAGLLSFARVGMAVTLEFASSKQPTIEALKELHAVVRAHGGTVNLADDQSISNELLNYGYPRAEDFAQWIDPGFSSNFWRRAGPRTNARPIYPSQKVKSPVFFDQRATPGGVLPRLVNASIESREVS